MISMESIFAILKNNIINILPSLSQSEINIEDSLKNLGANSIDRAEILIGTMAELKIKVPLIVLAEAKNIKDLVTKFHECIEASVAMLVSQQPNVFEVDLGANGYHGYEVMDTCRPEAEIETEDPDLSLLSYLDCLEASYKAYCDRVSNVDLQSTFSYFAFHTPFAGMVKGAHRKLMRQIPGITPETINADFEKRITPSLRYCVEVGNVYSATTYLALYGLIDSTMINGSARVGIYSYG